MNNKKAKTDKDKSTAKTPVLRSKAERQAEAHKVISKLNDLELNVAYEPVKKLFTLLNDYVDNGGRIKVNIPFPMINKRICGYLPDTVNDQCCIALIHEDFN